MLKIKAGVGRAETKKNLSLFSIINFLHHAKIHRRKKERLFQPLPPTSRHDEDVHSLFGEGGEDDGRKAKIIKGKLTLFTA